MHAADYHKAMDLLAEIYRSLKSRECDYILQTENDPGKIGVFVTRPVIARLIRMGDELFGRVEDPS